MNSFSPVTTKMHSFNFHKAFEKSQIRVKTAPCNSNKPNPKLTFLISYSVFNESGTGSVLNSSEGLET